MKKLFVLMFMGLCSKGFCMFSICEDDAGKQTSGAACFMQSSNAEIHAEYTSDSFSHIESSDIEYSDIEYSDIESDEVMCGMRESMQLHHSRPLSHIHTTPAYDILRSHGADLEACQEKGLADLLRSSHRFIDSDHLPILQLQTRSVGPEALQRGKIEDKLQRSHPCMMSDSLHLSSPQTHIVGPEACLGEKIEDRLPNADHHSIQGNAMDSLLSRPSCFMARAPLHVLPDDIAGVVRLFSQNAPEYKESDATFILDYFVLMDILSQLEHKTQKFIVSMRKYVRRINELVLRETVCTDPVLENDRSKVLEYKQNIDRIFAIMTDMERRLEEQSSDTSCATEETSGDEGTDRGCNVALEHHGISYGMHALYC